METINLKEEVRNLIDKLPENFTWPDPISAVYLRQAMKSEPIQVKGIKQGKNIQAMPPNKRRAPLFGSDREVITISDNFDEPLEDFQDYM